MHLRADPQLPVLQVPLSELLKEHPVLPHIRPCHPGGAVKTVCSPGFRVGEPVLLMFSLGVIPGHTVSLQWFTMVMFVLPESKAPVSDELESCQDSAFVLFI